MTHILDGMVYGDALCYISTKNTKKINRGEHTENIGMIKNIEKSYVGNTFNGKLMMKYMSNYILNSKDENINVIIDIYESNEDLDWFQCVFSKDLQYDIITNRALSRNGMIVELTLRDDLYKALTQSILQTLSTHSNCISVFCSFIHTLWLRIFVDYPNTPYICEKNISVYDVYLLSIKEWNTYIQKYRGDPIIYKWLKFVNNYKKKNHLNFTYSIVKLFSRFCDLCENKPYGDDNLIKDTNPSFFIERMKKCLFKDINAGEIEGSDCIRSMAIMFWIIEWSRSKDKLSETLSEKKYDCIRWISQLKCCDEYIGTICGGALGALWKKYT